MIIETQEIKFLEPKSKILPKKKKSFCETFVYEPENIEELSLGNLYLLGKLEGVSEDLEHLVNLLSSIIKREYYKNPQSGSLKSLEQSLKATNQHLSNLAQRGNLKWLGRLSFLGMTICQNELVFTQTGPACAFLFRDSHLLDISKKLVPSPENPHPQKIFQSVVSGKVEPEDTIILATKELSNLISCRGLKQIICSQIGQPLEKIGQKIEGIAREQKSPCFGAMLLIKTKPDQEEKINSIFPDDKKYVTPPINLEEIFK